MNPFYTLSVEYPQTVDYYGLLAGLAFNLPYCVVGLWAGSLVDKIKNNRNRSLVFSVACLGWSATTLASGYFDSFGIFALARFAQGAFISFENPFGLSIVPAFFPDEKKTTALSVFNGAIYLGGGLASLNVILTKELGWRGAYEAMGWAGIAIGVIGILAIDNYTWEGEYGKKTE